MQKKILIVDDNEHILRLLKISLEKSGYKVECASNGDEGLEKAEEFRPDLIISDVMMPRTDGIEFCWMVRENSSIPMVPFIFLTSMTGSDMEIRGFRAGADEYLVKPIDRKILLGKVEELLDHSEKVRKMDNSPREAVKGFEGNLSDFSLAELIQLLNLNQRSGKLWIEGDRDGEIIFHNGNMVFAKSGNVLGDEAVLQIVPCRKGFFHFEPGEKQTDTNIKGTTMNLLLEACRLADEESFTR
ncbi:MAG: response regulator [Calditrichia bacterium]